MKYAVQMVLVSMTYQVSLSLVQTLKITRWDTQTQRKEGKKGGRNKGKTEGRKEGDCINVHKGSRLFCKADHVFF
jgi:hypothetical protein